MKLIVKNLTATFLIIAIAFTACQSKDERMKKAVTEALRTVPGVSADVKDGFITLTGTVNNEAMKIAAESYINKIEGIGGITNNIVVNTSVESLPVEPSKNPLDDVLLKAVTDITKDFPTVKSSVKDGIIVLKGQISNEKWKKLKPAIEALKPKALDILGLTVTN